MQALPDSLEIGKETPRYLDTLDGKLEEPSIGLFCIHSEQSRVEEEGVAKLVDALGLELNVRNDMRVRVPSPSPPALDYQLLSLVYHMAVHNQSILI